MNNLQQEEWDMGQDVTEAGAVNEIIREEGAPDTLEDIAKEIQGVMAVNALLNRALSKSTDQVAELQRRIDEMLRIANQISGHANNEAWEIVDGISDTGTHADRSMSILATMRRIKALVLQITYDVSRISAASQGDNRRKHQDYDEVPF